MKTTQPYYLPSSLLDVINRLSKDELMRLLEAIPEISDVSPHELHNHFEELHFTMLTGNAIETEKMKSVFTAYYGFLKLLKALNTR